MNLSNRLVSGTSWLGGFSLLITVFAFASNIILARLLIPEQFGLFTLAMTVAGILGILFKFSFRSAIIQCREQIPDLIDTAFLFILGMALTHLFVGILVTPIVQKIYGVQVRTGFLVLTFIIAIGYLSNGYLGVMERELQYKSVGGLLAGAAFISHSASIFLAFSGWGWWSLVIREGLRTIILLVGARWMSKYTFHWRLNREAARYIWRFGKAMFGLHSIDGIVGRLDKWLIGTFLSVETLGFYNQGFRLSKVGNEFIEPFFGRGSWGAYAELQFDKKRLSKTVSLLSYWSIRFTIPIAIVVIFFAEPLVVIIYGENWRPAGPILKGFVLSILLGPLVGNMRAFFSATGQPGFVARMNFFRLLFAIGTMMCLGYFYGGQGVAWAMSLTTTFMFILLLLKVKDRVIVDWMSVLIKPLLIGGLILPVVWFIRSILVAGGRDGALEVVLMLAFIFAFYVVMLFVVDGRKLRDESRYLLSKYAFGKVIFKLLGRGET